MIVREFYKIRSDGTSLHRTYSNSNYMICKVGTNEIYEEAIDIEGAECEYVETEQPIEKIELPEEQDISESEALNIILGGETDQYAAGWEKTETL